MKEHKNYTYEEIPEEDSGAGLDADFECDECNININMHSKFTRFELEKHKRFVCYSSIYVWKIFNFIK